jgi:hypothetical protein
MATLFDRLAQGRQLAESSQSEKLEPEIVRRGPQPIIPLIHLKSSPSEKLLAWLVNYWARPTITLRDICAYGPHSVRDPKDVMNLTQTLTEFGWLIPVEAWRRDQKKWRVVREPSKEAAK